MKENDYQINSVSSDGLQYNIRTPQMKSDLNVREFLGALTSSLVLCLSVVVSVKSSLSYNNTFLISMCIGQKTYLIK
jgi:hypothetical protein